MSGNITTNGPTIELGALIGSLFGPEGTLPGALIGSMFGIGGSVSYVPGTGSLYAGPVATFGVGISGRSGFSVSAVHVPSSENANSIANGKSLSLSYQPNPFLGSTDLAGPGVDIGGVIANGVGIGGDVSVGSTDHGLVYQGTLTLGFGAGGKGAAGVLTRTSVTPFCQAG